MSFVLMNTIAIKKKLANLGLVTTDKHFGKNLKSKNEQYIIYLSARHLNDDYESIRTRIEYALKDFCVDVISPAKYQCDTGTCVELWCFVTKRQVLETA